MAEAKGSFSFGIQSRKMVWKSSVKAFRAGNTIDTS